MPSFCSITGYAPFLVGGVPFSRRESWMDTFKNWSKTPGAWLNHSLAVTEAAYVELANIVRADRTGEVNIYNYVDVAVDGSPVAYQGMLQDMTLIAMRYGREFDLPYATCCGLDRARGIVGLTQIDVPVTITDAEAHNYYNLAVEPAVIATTNVLTVNQLTSPLYPVMTYGIGNERYYSAALHDSITTHGIESRRDGIIFTDVTDFTRFMNIHRMMGYDITATNVLNGKRISNWADNASGRFLYTDINHLDLAQVYKINRDDIVRRPNCWVGVEDLEGSITVEYTMSQLQMVMFCGSDRLRPGGAIISTAPPPPGVDVHKLAATHGGVRFIPIRKVEAADFRFVRLTLTNPVLTTHTVSDPLTAHPSGEEMGDGETPTSAE
jgi:hypothetical protein